MGRAPMVGEPVGCRSESALDRCVADPARAHNDRLRFTCLDRPFGPSPLAAHVHHRRRYYIGTAALTLRKKKSREQGCGAHSRLCVLERTSCGQPSPLPATLASLRDRSNAFCKSFTFRSRWSQTAVGYSPVGRASRCGGLVLFLGNARQQRGTQRPKQFPQHAGRVRLSLTARGKRRKDNCDSAMVSVGVSSASLACHRIARNQLIGVPISRMASPWDEISDDLHRRWFAPVRCRPARRIADRPPARNARMRVRTNL